MRTSFLAPTVFAILTVMSVPTLAPATPSTLPLSTPMTLPIVFGQGTELTIDPGRTARGWVFVFLSARCPCSASHEGKLRQLAAEFAPRGFAFVGIHANADETRAEARKHFEESRLGFPVVRDDGKLADALGALKTPHVFVISKERNLLYAGGVDDSKDAARAKKEFLRDALIQITAGEVPQVRETRTLGCMIKRKPPL